MADDTTNGSKRPDMIPINQLVHGALYRVSMRNGSIGVWNAESFGFIFIRYKHGSKYLFTEYHYDTSTAHGTACPTLRLPDRLPEGIRVSTELSENPVVTGTYLNGPPSTWASQLEAPGFKRLIALDRGVPVEVEHRQPAPGVPFKLFYPGTDEELPRGVCVASQDNRPLFDWLEKMEAKYAKQIEGESDARP